MRDRTAVGDEAASAAIDPGFGNHDAQEQRERPQLVIDDQTDNLRNAHGEATDGQLDHQRRKGGDPQ
jgi:hypothetical protein